MAPKVVDSLPFEIEARVPIQLGRESISSSMVAVLELVKNAYDADATEVIIDLSKSNFAKSTITIADNGHGMDEADLKNGWLTIGTDRKASKIKSPKFLRTVTGAKGLGRLGVDRLAKNLSLYTRREKMSRVLQLEIDWSCYEKKSAVLSKVLNTIYSHELRSNKEIVKKYLGTESVSGTVLQLKNLRDRWDDKYMRYN